MSNQGLSCKGGYITLRASSAWMKEMSPATVDYTGSAVANTKNKREARGGGTVVCSERQGMIGETRKKHGHRAG